MGLGKTAQAIAATELLARHFGAERLLVVCPISLKHQWQQEIAWFAGREAQRALKRIESPYAIVLTGTPLENRLEELVSIVQFVDQHRLGPAWRLLHDYQARRPRPGEDPPEPSAGYAYGPACLYGGA